MNIYHSCFRFWRNFQDKDKFCWIAITKSTPPDYFGNTYDKLAPIGSQYEEAVHPFNAKKFFNIYVQQLKSLNKKTVLDEIKAFSENGNDIVLLNWEPLGVLSEGRLAYAWMMNMNMQMADFYDLETQLELMKKRETIHGDNFLNV